MASDLVLTCAEVRACEERAVEAGASWAGLMERAGAACADTLHRLYPEGRVVALAGPGNNGGDAWVAAHVLAGLGRDVVVLELDATASLSVEAAAARAAYTGERQPLGAWRFVAGEVVLDGLFGAGLSRPLEGLAQRTADRLNALGAPVVAIDVPSGVRGDTGQSSGSVIRAAHTVTFDARKPAHLLQPAADLCGEVHVVEIGLAPFLATVSAGRLVENGPAQWAAVWPWPDAAAHKHRRGRLVVVSGGVAQTGAARLAAQAGLRIGAGLVTLLCPPSALMVAASQLTAVMVRAVADPDDLAAAAHGAHAAVVGPASGVGETMLRMIATLAERGVKLVLDADALTSLAEANANLEAISSRTACVLTPHQGEFDRLFPGLGERSVSKVEAVRTAAKESGCVVLLKGPDTVIADPGGRAAINVHATPFLATAGSGDVLAGIIGGLLAQGMDAFDAARAGAWIHGDAGRRAGPGLTAEDLDLALRDSLRALYNRQG